jgi:hypothetical protein
MKVRWKSMYLNTVLPCILKKKSESDSEKLRLGKMTRPRHGDWVNCSFCATIT